MKKLLIFDLDGTVADTLGAITEALNMALEKLGFRTLTEAEVRTFISYAPLDFARYSLPEDKRNDDGLAERTRLLFAGMYRKTYLHTDKCFDGLPEVLEKLKNDGYILAMNSNKADDMMKAMNKNIVRKGLFSAAVGVIQGRPVKPDPAGALAICRELGVQPEDSIYIGDSDIDVNTAKNAGMVPVNVSWGYKSEDELRQAGAGLIAATPDELYAVIRSID